ncbi:MAG: cytochrome P460 family protein [Spirochaetales bacterium]|nr:cytochrome P460 family protein [Spirochaetales bacterium]
MSGRPRSIRALSVAVVFPALCFALSCGNAAPRAPLLPPDYASWRRTTAVSLDYPIPGHMDDFRIIRANELAFRTVRRPVPAGDVDFPAGAIVVKEAWPRGAVGGTPGKVFFMVKSPADPSARGGWVWGMLDPASGAEQIFESAFCIGCHANANEKYPYADGNPGEAFRDYVFFPPGLPGADPEGYP